jgi:hypothetical protein
MSNNEPEIPTWPVADLLEQLAGTPATDAELIAMLNASQSPGTSDGRHADNDPAERTAQLQLDAAGYAAALQTLVEMRQMSLLEFLADDAPEGSTDDASG